MKASHLVSTLVIFYSLSAHASAWQYCKDTFFRLIAGDPDQIGWLKAAGLEEKLRVATVAYKEKQARPLAASSVDVSGLSYQLLQRLGTGSESDLGAGNGVFLARDPEGQLRSVKIFNNRTVLEQNTYSLERLSAEGRRTAAVVAVDPTLPIAVLEYVEGVPVHDLLIPGAFGLTAKEQEKIRKRFKAECLAPFRDLEFFNRSVNTVLDVNTGEFVLIDPH